ncbi:MAG: hypothetical protein EXR72_10315 [Myxococcales bacterium]|nr:hypothetical protein [Myxococcales bacterium]
MLRALVIALLLAAPPAGAATEIGLSGPAVYGGDVASAVAAAKVVAETGTGWARVNFRLDLWSAPDDATLRGPDKLGFYQAYDRIIDALVTRGVRVYALVGGESVPGGGDPDSDDFVKRYTAAFVKIVDHFKDRVRVYETFNEPNNWRFGTMQPEVSPYYFAAMQQKIWLAVRHDGGRDQDPCNQVAIVSGGLFSFEGTDATDYLKQVYAEGRSKLAWDWMLQNVGTYPLDGVGYHIYVGQGMQATPQTVAAATTKNAAAAFAALASKEPDGAQTKKRIWLSEYGWTVDQVTAQQQAAFLTASTDALAAEGHVAAAFWFTYQDFPNGLYGLYDANGLLPKNRRPAYDAFVAEALKRAPLRWARLESGGPPAMLVAGTTSAPFTVAVRNTGAEAWPKGGPIRLGAGGGCPASVGANQILWAPASGYVNSFTDARVFTAGDTPAGAVAKYDLALVAPKAPGSYRFAARMVKDGVEWFGDTIQATVTVVAPPPDLGPSDLGPPDLGPPDLGPPDLAQATGDAGAPIPVDAGELTDGAIAADTARAVDDGGVILDGGSCSCRIGAHASGAPTWVLLLLLAGLLRRLRARPQACSVAR